MIIVMRLLMKARLLLRWNYLLQLRRPTAKSVIASVLANLNEKSGVNEEMVGSNSDASDDRHSNG